MLATADERASSTGVAKRKSLMRGTLLDEIHCGTTALQSRAMTSAGETLPVCWSENPEKFAIAVQKIPLSQRSVSGSERQIGRSERQVSSGSSSVSDFEVSAADGSLKVGRRHRQVSGSQVSGGRSDRSTAGRY